MYLLQASGCFVFERARTPTCDVNITIYRRGVIGHIVKMGYLQVFGGPISKERLPAHVRGLRDVGVVVRVIHAQAELALGVLDVVLASEQALQLLSEIEIPILLGLSEKNEGLVQLLQA